MTRLIEHICRAADHQQLPLLEADASWAPNLLTFRDGAWAYCPSGKPDGHDWEHVTARPYEGLRDETEQGIAASPNRASGVTTT